MKEEATVPREMVGPPTSRFQSQLSSALSNTLSPPHVLAFLSLTFLCQTLGQRPAEPQLCNQTSTQLWTLPGMLLPALSFNPDENELKAKLPLSGVCFSLSSGVSVPRILGHGQVMGTGLTKCLHPHHLLGEGRSLASESLALFKCRSCALTDQQ